MSLELYVISPRRLQSIQEWQRAVDKYSFPIKFDLDIDFNEISGFLPLRLRGKLSGFECDHWPLDDILETYEHIKIDPNFKHALAFRWGGNYNEHISAIQASAAYSVATGGLVFDCQEGDFLPNEKSIEEANKVEEWVNSLR